MGVFCCAARGYALSHRPSPVHTDDATWRTPGRHCSFSFFSPTPKVRGGMQRSPWLSCPPCEAAWGCRRLSTGLRGPTCSQCGSCCCGRGAVVEGLSSRRHQTPPAHRSAPMPAPPSSGGVASPVAGLRGCARRSPCRIRTRRPAGLTSPGFSSGLCTPPRLGSQPRIGAGSTSSCLVPLGAVRRCAAMSRSSHLCARMGGRSHGYRSRTAP